MKTSVTLEQSNRYRYFTVLSKKYKKQELCTSDAGVAQLTGIILFIKSKSL